MAHDSHAPRSSAALIAEIAHNREELAAAREQLHHSMDVGTRMQRSFHDNAGMFLGTAAVLGVLLALIPSRRAKVDKRTARQIAAAAVQEERQRQPKARSESKSLTAVLLGLAGKAALDMGKPIVLKMLRDHYLNTHHPAAPQPPARQPI